MANRSNRDATLRTTLSALLLAMMLILGYVESLLPISVGIPGIKLGLSNGVLIFAVYMLDAPTGYTLMALKVLLSGMLFAGPSTMMYGFAGGLLSMTGMVLLARSRRLPVTVVSAVGGILHNLGQIGLSLLILQVPLKAMLLYILVLTGVGCACGVLTGVCATSVMKHLKAVGWKTGSKRATGSRRWVIALLALVLAGAVGVWALWKQPAQQPGTSVDWQVEGAPEVALPWE